MSDIFKSTAFQEFLQKRIEEITMDDEEYERINKLILQKEAEIQSIASGELLIKLKEYEKLNLDLLAHTQPLIYGQAIRDFKIGGK